MKVALELELVCGQRSGIGTYAYELSNQMVQMNDSDIQFCGHLFNFRRKRNAILLQSELKFPIQENRWMSYGIYRRLWNIIPLSYGMIFPDKVDIHHFFNYIVPPHVEGKVVTTIHDMTYARFPETMSKRNLHRIQKDINYSIERSDRIVTISEFAKREIIELLKVPEDKIDIIYNVTPIIGQVMTFQTVASKYEIHGKYLLFIGNIEPRKNLVRLIHAFKKVCLKLEEPIQLVLAGGQGWRSEEIYQSAQDMGKLVRFTGYISVEEKATLLKNATGFVFPSLYEGWGIPILEAMSCGIPVLYSDVASMPEASGGHGWAVDPYNEDDIVQGLYNLITNQQQNQQFIKDGFQQAKKFTGRQSAIKMLDIYKELM